MKKQIQIFEVILVLCLMLQSSDCYNGVTPYSYYPTSVFQCIKQNGYTNASVLVLFNEVDLDEKNKPSQSLVNIKNAGLPSNVILILYPLNDAIEQVNIFKQKINQSLYDRIWIGVFPVQQNVFKWTSNNADTNCNFLRQAISELKKLNVKLGILTDQFFWNQAMKNECNEFSSQFQLFWYLKDFDGEASFDNFIPFANWRAPTVKQYQTKLLCGAIIGFNYYQKL